MPNQRAPGQRLINFPASESFIREMEKAFRAAGYSNRSEFIRDAIVEKLEKAGITVDASLALAPARTGTIRPRRQKVESKTLPIKKGVSSEEDLAEQVAPDLEVHLANERLKKEVGHPKRKPSS